MRATHTQHAERAQAGFVSEVSTSGGVRSCGRSLTTCGGRFLLLSNAHCGRGGDVNM